MPSNTFTSAALALLAGSADAFWRMPCPGRIVQERADPIISPGVVSGHVHTISGGNGFGFTMDYAQARASECSSCPIKEDLSNYWVPKLYYEYENGSFVDVPQAGDGDSTFGGQTVYYLQRGPDISNLTAFPEGFRMVAGDPFKREGGTDFASQAISYVCLDYSGTSSSSDAFPTINCPDGLRAQVFFPSCWDGVNLDSADHKSHMSYPASGAVDNGPCPASHPVQLISIFYEIIFSTGNFADMWYGDKQPFRWAMGDPTGYGFHGDFVNGWDIDVLQAATNDCLDDSGLITDCPHFSFYSNEQCQSCLIPPSVDEPVTGVLAELPGCNPVTWGPAEASIPADCPTTPIGQPETYYTDVTTSLGYEYVGCGNDSVSDRTFSAASESSSSMTVESCVKYCKAGGYTYAGLQYSSQCYCGDTLADDRAPQPGYLGNCFMTCAGDSGEYCGGAAWLSMYKDCDGGSCQNAQYGVVGNGTSSKVRRHLGGHMHHARHAS